MLTTTTSFIFRHTVLSRRRYLLQSESLRHLISLQRAVVHVRLHAENRHHYLFDRIQQRLTGILGSSTCLCICGRLWCCIFLSRRPQCTVVVAAVSVGIGQSVAEKKQLYHRLTVVAATGKDQTSSPSPTVPTFSLTEVVAARPTEEKNTLVVCALVFLVCVRGCFEKARFRPIHQVLAPLAIFALDRS